MLEDENKMDNLKKFLTDQIKIKGFKIEKNTSLSALDQQVLDKINTISSIDQKVMALHDSPINLKKTLFQMLKSIEIIQAELQLEMKIESQYSQLATLALSSYDVLEKIFKELEGLNTKPAEELRKFFSSQAAQDLVESYGIKPTGIKQVKDIDRIGGRRRRRRTAKK
jgi:hypothetical protein